MATKKKVRRVQPLFLKILLSILIPFLSLLVLFGYLSAEDDLSFRSAYEKNQAHTMSKLLDLQYAKILSDPKTYQDSDLCKGLAAEIRQLTMAETVTMLDPESPQPISTVSDPAKRIPRLSPREEAAQHVQQIQKSLSLFREGMPFHILTDDKKGRITVYRTYHPAPRQYLIVALNYPLTTLADTFSHSMRLLSLMLLIGAVTALGITLLLSFQIIQPVLAITRACQEILKGNLGRKAMVRTGDEMELLALNFNRVSQAMLVMTHAAGDANPLTQLPGNRMIREEVNHRLAENQKFVFFHVDIDHFKAYNDEYGLSKGDDALRRTASVLTDTVKDFPGRNFVGHQGGDDFILVLEVAQAEKIAKLVCTRFDESIREFYKPEDLQRGYFMGKEARSSGITEDMELKRQPLMSVSLAGVTNLKRPYQAFEDVLEHAVTVKKRVKKIPYSVFLIEE